MPVEIKELIIRAVAGGAERKGSENADPPEAQYRNEAIVAACVKQVLRILKSAKER